jgi:hypothetical protein
VPLDSSSSERFLLALSYVTPNISIVPTWCFCLAFVFLFIPIFRWSVAISSDPVMWELPLKNVPSNLLRPPYVWVTDLNYWTSRYIWTQEFEWYLESLGYGRAKLCQPLLHSLKTQLWQGDTY